MALKTAARGANRSRLLIVDIATGKPVIDTGGTSVQDFIGFAGADRFVLLSGAQGTDWYSATDGKRVLTIENSRAIDYDLAAMTDAARQIPVIDAAPTENGQLLVTALKDGRVTTWYPGSRPRYGAFGAMPMPDLEPVAQFDHGETLGATATWSTIPPLFVSPDGRYIASQSDGMKTNAVGGLTSFKPMVRVWDVRHRGEIARFTPRLGMAVVFSPASDLIAILQRPADRDPGGKVQLDLWRLSSGNGAAERLSVDTADFLPKPDKSGLKVYSIAASADGRRLVWLSVDGQLWVRRTESGQIEVIDQLRPIAKRVFADSVATWEQKLQSLDPQAREGLSNWQGPIDPFTYLDTLLEKNSARAPGPHLPDLIVPVLPIVVSGNGCCVLVAIGPLLRLYDLDDHRVIAERVIGDMVIQPPGSGRAWQDLVMSYDGRAFATSILTRAGSEAAGIAQSERLEKGGHEPPTTKGEIRAFSLGADGVVGAFEQTLLPIPPAAAWFPMSRALAIDSHGRQIAIDRITQDQGKPNGTRRIAVVDLADPVTVVMETPAEGWNFNPVQMLFDPAQSTTLRAGFSTDDQ